MSWTRLSSKLAIWFVVGISSVILLVAHFYVGREQIRLRRQMEWRAEVLAESIREKVEPQMRSTPIRELERTVERFEGYDGVLGLAVFDEHGSLLAASASLASRLAAAPTAVTRAIAQNQEQQEFLALSSLPAHVCVLPLHRNEALTGALALYHDATSVQTQSAQIWRDTLLGALLLSLLITLIILVIVRWSITGPIARTAAWMRDIRLGYSWSTPPEPLFGPLQAELAHFVRNLTAARAAAEEEARLRDAAESQWTAERLRVHVQSRLEGSRLCVVSNREPYMHVHRGKSVEVVVPPSGLVTALEPVLRACDGTWVAHGAGDADLGSVDAHGRLRVPPEEPHYTLRRVWLNKEEEEGYYYGFANEGLWPLCHIAHTRPIFRTSDWQHYQQVNRKFAKAVLEEMAGVRRPVLLVQDYHFGLLPRLVKERRPDARVAIFWHIPWPNPEAFGICPQQRELLDGLLGADLIGFHIQAHCLNFLETVDCAVESRIEWERSTVNRGGHLTLVKPFPISVTFSGSESGTPSPSASAGAILQAQGLDAKFMGVGVDRVDYTKGILERFHGIERFLEKYPAYQGQFTFVQIGAPSRTHIKRYDLGAAEVGELRALGNLLHGRSVLMVNSTAVGGGVAEILNRLVPLMEEIGLKIRWEVITGGNDFFEVTKAFHNALHGAPYEARPEHFETFLAYNRRHRSRVEGDPEFRVIHDPQPARSLMSARTIRATGSGDATLTCRGPTPRSGGSWNHTSCAMTAPSFRPLSSPGNWPSRSTCFILPSTRSRKRTGTWSRR